MKLLPFLILLFSAYPLFAQLGFCEGSKGDPIFHEDFGTGSSSGPALPSSVTSYTYVTGDPEDGAYTISNRIGQYNSTWHSYLPSTSASNGRALIVNASFVSGQFYRKEITGLCQNTSYEFSAYLMNVYNRGSNGCENGGIPNNVRFEIWDQTESVLLKSGNTGDIHSTTSPQWKQFALTFQSEAGQGSVFLKMFNNGVGGCGNDLAIDDIIFRSCGDFTQVSQENTNNTSLQVCEEEAPVSLTLKAISDGSVYSSHFYQWQESLDGTQFTDIPGQIGESLSIVSLTMTKHYRVKVAEDASNLQDNLCSSASESFYIEILETPSAPISFGNVEICSNETNPGLRVQVEVDESVNWYDAPTGGNLVLENSDLLFPTDPGNYYAQAYNKGTMCSPSPRTAVSFSVFQAPEVEDEVIYLCNNSFVTLKAGVGNMKYLWSTGDSTSEITVNTSGTYFVKIESLQGCTTTKSIEVMAVEPAEIKEIISAGTTVEIVLEEPGAFLYSLDGNIFHPTGHFPSVSGGIYTAYVKDVQNCEVVTQQFLHLVFPKFLTPNNDGYNDYFEVKGLSFYGLSELRIFDRYGRLLFSQSDADVKWDGTLGGRALPSDDYWFTVKIEGFEIIEGHFSLIR